MNRRDWMQIAVGGALASAAGGSAFAQAKPAGDPKGEIVLYCDLKVDPKREKEMLEHFHTKFKPAGEKFKGYMGVKMVKYDHKVQGPDIAPGVNYRFQLQYESLALQQKWVTSPTHVKLWPGIGNCLLDQNFQVLVFHNA